MAGITGQRYNNGSVLPVKPPYGVCSSGANDQTKVVTVPSVSALEAGLFILVKFANAQSYDGVPKLNVNGLGAKDLKTNGTTGAARYEWNAGEVLPLYYDGTYWLIVRDGTASTTYYGKTKLTNAVDSDSEVLAASAKAVKTVKDLVSGKLDADQGSANAGKFMKVGNDGNLIPDTIPDPTGKADKVSGATSGNFAALDANGNLIDSGHKHSDYLTDHQDISGKADKSATVSNVAYDSTNKKITKTVNGTTSDVVSASTLKSDMGLGNVNNTSDADKPVSTATQTALNQKLNASEKGAAGGVAELDSTGKIPASQLPSYVDDVLEYASLSNFPTTGENGKIYIATDTNKQYRWSGTQYVEIASSLALGETSSTAYRGDRGKAAYDHATDTYKVSSAQTEALYKVSVTSEGHVGTVTPVQKSDITALGIPGSDTDTKNTAGTVNKAGEKMFLVGATTQGANPETNSNSKVFIGTDNELYSNEKKVAHAEDIKQMTGASASAAGTAGTVPAPGIGDQDKFFKGDGTWGTVSGANVSAAFTDVNFSIAVADWIAITGGFKAIVQNSAFTATSKIWYFLNADYYENAPAPFNFEVVAGGVEITTEEKPVGVVSGVLRTVEAIPVTDATEQVLAGTLRVVPFSIGKNDWTLDNGAYKYNKVTEYVTLSSVEFVEYDSSFRDAIRGDIEAVKTTGGGGMTFVTNAQPVGTLTGEIRVFDRNDGKVAILTEQTALPTMRDVPFTVEVSDWAINASGKYEAVFETAYVTSTSHDFVEFDESIENATDGIKVIKAEYDGEVIGLKFVSRRIPAGDISGTVTPLDNADGKVAVALQGTVMPIANGGTGASTLQGAQDALGITELRNSLSKWHLIGSFSGSGSLDINLTNYETIMVVGVQSGRVASVTFPKQFLTTTIQWIYAGSYVYNGGGYGVAWKATSTNIEFGDIGANGTSTGPSGLVTYVYAM